MGRRCSGRLGGDESITHGFFLWSAKYSIFKFIVEVEFSKKALRLRRWSRYVKHHPAISGSALGENLDLFLFRQLQGNDECGALIQFTFDLDLHRVHPR